VKVTAHWICTKEKEKEEFTKDEFINIKKREDSRDNMLRL
jgi:hypothetical protein